MKQFYANQVMREEVREYFKKTIRERAVDKLFNREDTSHLADASELIDDIFDQMDIDFGVKKPSKSLNEQR